MFAVRLEGGGRRARRLRRPWLSRGDGAAAPRFVATRVVEAASRQEAIAAATAMTRRQLAEEFGSAAAEAADIMASDVWELEQAAARQPQGFIWQSDTAHAESSRRLVFSAALCLGAVLIALAVVR